MRRTRFPLSEETRVRPGAGVAALLLALLAPAAIAQKTAGAQPNKPESEPRVDEILQQMSRITGLPVKAPLKSQRVSKAEVEQYLKENLAAEYTPDELHGQEAALKAFGVVGPEFNLHDLLVSLYTEQAAGYYDPRRKTMFMADWVPADQQKMVLAHELTHALQDQSFDLWNFMHATPDDDDATAARQALVEGHATLAMIQAMLGSVPIEKLPSLDTMMTQIVNQQMTEYPVFSKTPFFLRFQVLFPYAQGMHFVHQGLMAGGWKQLNELFEKPPATTREIFQPDLYFKPRAKPDQSPPLLDLPAPVALQHAAGLKQVEANSMGEMGYYALLGQLVSQAEAEKTGKSWAADRYAVYEGPQPGQLVLIARTRWQNAESANAFCSDYRTILEKRWPQPGGGAKAGAEPAQEAGSRSLQGLIFSSPGPRRTFLLRQGNECRWAEGVPADNADTVAKWLESLP